MYLVNIKFWKDYGGALLMNLQHITSQLLQWLFLMIYTYAQAHMKSLLYGKVQRTFTSLSLHHQGQVHGYKDNLAECETLQGLARFKS